jgi:hypothetical protein
MVILPPIEPGSPPWFERYALALKAAFASPEKSPSRLYAQPTANRPPAAQWVGSIMYDTTLSQVVYSDGSAWNAL